MESPVGGTLIFPEGYRHWLGSRLSVSVSETQATCDNCAMVQPTGITRDPGPFRADLKCCTYFPFVPNFALGAMLKNYGASARARIESACGRGVLMPLGLFAAAEHELLIQELGQDAFGKSDRLLCPFFDKAMNSCSVWLNRPGVCSSYFCKSDRGQAGLAYWGQVEEYLNQFEWTLANATAWRMGFTQDELELCEAVMLTSIDERDELLGHLWSEWHGREFEFYEASLSRALEISSDDLDELFDEETLALEASLR